MLLILNAAFPSTLQSWQSNNLWEENRLALLTLFTGIYNKQLNKKIKQKSRCLISSRYLRRVLMGFFSKRFPFFSLLYLTTSLTIFSLHCLPLATISCLYPFRYNSHLFCLCFPQVCLFLKHAKGQLAYLINGKDIPKLVFYIFFTKHMTFTLAWRTDHFWGFIGVWAEDEKSNGIWSHILLLRNSPRQFSYLTKKKL